MLLEQAAFKFREHDFLVDAQHPCSLLPGEPAEGRPVSMLRGPSGRAWRAQRAGHPFTVTIEDGHDEVLSHVLRQCSRLLLQYLAVLEIVSEEGEDGLALYQLLDGAAGHSSENYVNVINSTLTLLLHEFGHAIEQQARNRGNASFIDEWKGAIRADAVDLSAYPLKSAWEDCAEFSTLHGIALTRGSLEQLRGHSPERLRLWTWALEQVNGPLHPGAYEAAQAAVEAAQAAIDEAAQAAVDEAAQAAVEAVAQAAVEAAQAAIDEASQAAVDEAAQAAVEAAQAAVEAAQAAVEAAAQAAVEAAAQAAVDEAQAAVDVAQAAVEAAAQPRSRRRHKPRSTRRRGPRATRRRRLGPEQGQGLPEQRKRRSSRGECRQLRRGRPS